MDEGESIAVAVTADTAQFRREMAEMQRLASGLGNALTGAFEQATLRGRGFGEVLQTLGLRLSRLVLDMAMKPIEQGVAGLLGGLFAGGLPKVTPFANGGVVGAPTLFAMPGGGAGLMGEAGAEAILPLARGADGRLGVRAGGGSRATQVSVTINARDVDSFRRAQGEVAAMVARAVARGQRNL